MAGIFDPRKLLKQISNRLLQALFAKHEVLQELPWNELSETQVEPVFAAWQQLPDAKRKEIQVALQEVHDLAEGRGLKIFTEELCRNFSQHVDTFVVLDGPHDKAIWAFLNLPAAFEQAALFARVDALEGGRYWVKRNSLPRGQVAVDPHRIGELQQELRDHYWPTEMRGKHCKVEHYDRSNGHQYFYTYMDDWPDKQLVFADDGQMVPQNQRLAFSNVFVFNPEEGSLELAAKGGAAAHLSLQQAFCRSVLGIDVGPADPQRPAYRLDVLLDPSFTFLTDPADHIAQVFLRSVRIGPTTVAQHPLDYLEMKFARGMELPEVIESIRHCVGPDMLIRRATFEIVFLPHADHRVKQMSFYVGAPNTCNLKSKPDEVRSIGERCLQLWEISNG